MNFKKIVSIAIISIIPFAVHAQESERAARKKQDKADGKSKDKNAPPPAYKIYDENLKATMGEQDRKTRKRMEKNLKKAKKNARRKAYRNQPKRR